MWRWKFSVLWDLFWRMGLRGEFGKSLEWGCRSFWKLEFLEVSQVRTSLWFFCVCEFFDSIVLGEGLRGEQFKIFPDFPFYFLVCRRFSWGHFFTFDLSLCFSRFVLCLKVGVLWKGLNFYELGFDWFGIG